MKYRTSILSVVSIFILAAGLVGCGDDGVSPDGGVDSGTPTDGATDTGTPTDGATDTGTPTDGGMDSGTPDGGGALMFTGTVYVEGATDREPDGGVAPWPDGGMPDGAMVTPGGRVIGASVFLKNLAGEVMATTTTDAVGEYTLNAPTDTLTFLQVDPITDYAGSIRAELTRGGDYEAYEMVLPDEAGLVATTAAAGVTRDPATGFIACGFNPVDNDAGGEGAELGASITHDNAFNVTATGAIVGDRLVPLCEAGGGNPPGARPDAVCTTEDRAKQIFFPNVVESLAPVTPLDPEAGTCAERFAVDQWLTAPGCMTVVNIDCSL
ncbi:MAG: hypothetical protein DRJ42_17240 [Deltaproteobacteria bacterium]|nr:MAG: hypothetical protein DRJ42_17240 [Deltaproteobacteria bacterium]